MESPASSQLACCGRAANFQTIDGTQNIHSPYQREGLVTARGEGDISKVQLLPWIGELENSKEGASMFKDEIKNYSQSGAVSANLFVLHSEPRMKPEAELPETKGDETPAIVIDEPATDLENGLTYAEVRRRKEKYGPNALPEKKESLFIKFLKCFWGPMPIMIWIAILIEAINQNWPDFTVLMVLQVVNGLVSFIEAKNAGDAIAALKNALAPKAEVKRNGKWESIDARGLVPGDLIQLKLGDVVPADGLLCEGDPLSVDQAALTGESLPVTIWPNQDVKMGSSVKRGEAECIVTSIGAETFLGRAAMLVASVESQGRFQTILFRITLGLLFVSTSLVVVIFFFLVFHGAVLPLQALAVCVVLLVASIPIAMQVVCTSTMAVGSRLLAAKGAIVARLSAIEELAGMSILCSDKTGTLTKNELVLNDPILFGSLNAEELVFWSALSTKRSTGQERDAIDTVIVNGVADPASLLEYEQLEFVPFNPTDKRTEATVRTPSGEERRVIKGAPQVILNMCGNKADVEEAVNESVINLADRGYRPLGVAVTNAEGDFEMMGMLSLFDPPRDDTAETIQRAIDHGVSVKMITGDHTLIAKETARRLNMGTNILSVEAMEEDYDSLSRLALEVDGFAEVFPEHKFKIVDLLREQGFVVGMTGDGVNDAPALKRADIGVAVQGATEAARSAADIVLTEPGLMTIIEAIIRSRKIFQRMRNYCIYRVACSLQLLLFFFFSVLIVVPRQYFTLPHPVNSHAFVLPVTALVLITVLNDGTMITIAYDRVEPGKQPQKWNLFEVMVVSFILGSTACIGSVLFLLAGVNSAQGQNGPFAAILGPQVDAQGLPYVTYGQLLTAMYLKVSISDFLTVFSARTRGHALSRLPGKALAAAFLFATTTSSIIASQWFFPATPGVAGMKPLPAQLVGVVWAYCIVFWFIQDQVKLFTYWVLDVRRGAIAGVKAAGRERVKSWTSGALTMLGFFMLFGEALLSTVIAPVLPGYLSKLGSTAVGIAILFAAKPGVQILANPLINSFLDVTGPALPMVVGGLLQIVCTIMYAVGPNFGVLFFARFLHGFASAGIVSATLSLLSSTHGTRDRAGVMKLAMNGCSLGALAGPLLGGLLAQHSGTLGKANPFIVAAFVMIMTMLLLQYLIFDGAVPWLAHPTPPDAAINAMADLPAAPHETSVLVPEDWAGQHRAPMTKKLRARHISPNRRLYEAGRGIGGYDQVSDDEAGDIEQPLTGTSDSYGTESKTSSEVEEGATGSGFFSVLGDEYILVCWAGIALIAAILALLEPLVPLYLIKHFSSIATSPMQGGVLAACTASFVFAAHIAGRLLKTLRAWQVAVLGMLILIIGLVIVTLYNIIELVPVGMVVIGFGAGFVEASLMSIFTGIIGWRTGVPGAGFTVQNTAVNFGMCAGPIVGGALQASYGLEEALVAFAIAAGLMTPLLVFLRAYQK